MFETIGRWSDPQIGRRRLQAGFLVTLLAGVVAGGLAWELTTHTPEIPDEFVPIGRMVEADDELEELTLPKAPAARGGASQGVATTVSPQPDPVADPPPLRQKIERRVRSQTQPSGTTEPSPGEGPGTRGAGRGPGPGGVGPGCAGEDCGTGTAKPFRTPPTKRTTPELRYPKEARSLGIGDQVCQVRVRVDTRGKPQQIEVTGCPDVFQRAARDGVSRWTWYAARDVHRKKVAAWTSFRVRFRLR